MRGSSNTYLPAVDHLRAFAALLVVFFHAVQQLPARIPGGQPFRNDREWHTAADPFTALILEGTTAVTLFMVLSGFIFTVGAFGRQISFGRFMTNRVLRIYPLLLVVVMIGLAVVPGSFNLQGFAQLVGGLADRPGSLNLGFLSTMFWAVAIEMQFYLVFPLINAILTRFGARPVILLLCSIAVMRAMAWAAAGAPFDARLTFYNSLAGRIDQFMIGVLAGYLFVKHRKRLAGWGKTFGAMAIALAVLWGANHLHDFTSGDGWLLWLDVEGAMWALVIVTYVATCKGTGLAGRLAARVGELSYSIYLLHMVVLVLVMRKGLVLIVPGISPLYSAMVTTLLVIVPVIVCLAWLTYHGVEQPFLSLRRPYLSEHPHPEQDESHERGEQIGTDQDGSLSDPARQGVGQMQQREGRAGEYESEREDDQTLHLMPQRFGPATDAKGQSPVGSRVGDGGKQ